MEKEKIEDVTKKLQDLVKKRKTNVVVFKAGTMKTSTSNSNGSSADYYSTSSDE